MLDERLISAYQAMERNFRSPEEWLEIFNKESAMYLAGVFHPDTVINGKPLKEQYPEKFGVGRTGHGKSYFPHQIKYSGFLGSEAGRQIQLQFYNQSRGLREIDVIAIGPIVKEDRKGKRMFKLGEILEETDQPEKPAFSIEIIFTGPQPDLPQTQGRGGDNLMRLTIGLPKKYALEFAEDLRKESLLAVRLLEQQYPGISSPEIKFQTKKAILIVNPEDRFLEPNEKLPIETLEYPA